MKGLIFAILLIFVSCADKEIINYKINATCEKIIVQDSSNKKTLHFLVSFYNPNEKEVVFFSNSYDVDSKQKINKSAGICLRLNDTDIALVQPNSSTFFYIKPKEKIKMLYTYSKQYQKEELKIDSSISIDKQLNDVILYYKYNKKVMDSFLDKDKNENSNLVTPTSSFKVIFKKKVIEYREKLTIEDVVKLIN